MTIENTELGPGRQEFRAALGFLIGEAIRVARYSEVSCGRQVNYRINKEKEHVVKVADNHVDPHTGGPVGESPKDLYVFGIDYSEKKPLEESTFLLELPRDVARLDNEIVAKLQTEFDSARIREITSIILCSNGSNYDQFSAKLEDYKRRVAKANIR